MYETIIEIFNEKIDENHCLTLDGKKNVKNPISDGISLLKNISYFTSRKINKRAKNSYLDIFDAETWSEETDEGNPSATNSRFDEYVVKKFFESKSRLSRLPIYAEYLEWLQKYDVHKLFKTNACDIKAIIETIMNCEDTFIADAVGDMETGLGMHLVKQEVLQEIIRHRHNINIEQGNLSKDLEIIEQRLLDFLFYALNYRIEKAEKSKGVYEKESERFLYGLEKKAYVEIFSRTSYKIYDESVEFINGDINNDFDSYFRTIKKYDDMIIDIVSCEKGKKKYDMINLVLENDDLVDDKRETLLNMAKTVISYYENREEEYRKNRLSEYEIRGLIDWENGRWEAELESEVLKIKLWSNENVKKPIQHGINKEKIMAYCGYKNFYFCNVENKICLRVPKDRRIISRANKNHEIFMYNIG